MNLADAVLEILAKPQYEARGGAPLGDVLDNLRTGVGGYRWRVPGRRDAQYAMLEKAGFTVDLRDRKTNGPAGNTGHGSYVILVSL